MAIQTNAFQTFITLSGFHHVLSERKINRVQHIVRNGKTNNWNQQKFIALDIHKCDLAKRYGLNVNASNYELLQVKTFAFESIVKTIRTKNPSSIEA